MGPTGKLEHERARAAPLFSSSGEIEASSRVTLCNVPCKLLDV